MKATRILVADDSEDNRLLVEVYFDGGPYELVFEEDGEAAVSRFATADFDLILMDVRMPVMDGLTATRAIRALERVRGGPAVPIIALTADSGVKETQRSMDAGCNAHLSKPISRLDLLNAIEKFRRAVKPPDLTQPACLEPIGIEMPPGLEEIVPPYLARRKKEAAEMVQLLATSDFARLTTLGHNLKGTGGGYGFPDLVGLGAALEQFAKQQDRGALRAKMTELSHYLGRVELKRKT